jgi:hypothetical protein
MGGSSGATRRASDGCWGLDRVAFMKVLSDIREIRDEVMHFSPDPLSAKQDLTLVNFVKCPSIMDRGRTADVAQLA